MTTPPPPPYPRSADEPATEPPAAAEESDTPAPPAGGRQRRWWVVGIVAAAVVIVLAACGGIVVAMVRVGHAVADADAAGRRWDRVDDACRALEVRLNRVVPPGATAGPRERAAAVRNEDAAVKPLLDELGSLDDDRLVTSWQQLVDARHAYATALDRQAATREPAFFVVPRTDRGRSVVDGLESRWDDCAPSVRRLAAPDL